MNLKHILLTGAASLFCLGAAAQTLITLDEYRQRVIGYNQQIKASKEGVVAAEAKRNIVRVGFLPKFDISGQYAFTNKIEIFDGMYIDQHNYSGKIQVAQPLYTGGALQAQYKAAKIEKEIAVYNEAYTYDQILYNADMVYWTAAANKQFLESTQTYYNTVESLYGVIKKRFDDGMLSRTDLLQVQTRLKEAEQQLIAAKQGDEIARHNLNILMGEELTIDFRPANSIEQIVNKPEELSLDAVLAQRPDFAIAGKQVLLQEQNSKAAVAKFNPQLAIGGSGQWGTKQINVDGSTMTIGNAFASLSFPVFHWGERKYTKAATQAAVRLKKLELELQRDNIQRELTTAWSQIEQYSSQLEVAKENLTLSQENLDLNTFSYTEGKLPILDVLSAQMSWVQAFTSLIKSNLGYKSAVAEYERIISVHSHR